MKESLAVTLEAGIQKGKWQSASEAGCIHMQKPSFLWNGGSLGASQGPGLNDTLSSSSLQASAAAAALFGLFPHPPPCRLLFILSFNVTSSESPPKLPILN